MNIQTLLADYLIGEPLQDSITIAILFTIIWTFYNVIFEAVFSIFKKN